MNAPRSGRPRPRQHVPGAIHPPRVLTPPLGAPGAASIGAAGLAPPVPPAAAAPPVVPSAAQQAGDEGDPYADMNALRGKLGFQR